MNRSISTPIRYQSELDLFLQKFRAFKEKRIVLYGIGLRTALFLPYLSDFNILGLLDRNPDNVGKIIGGIPVITMQQAEKNADLIIINSSPANFKIIYRRIESCKLPVYYANGERAAEDDRSYMQRPYWNVSPNNLKKEIDSHEVISFDCFDTLIMRKVYDPGDVFQLLQLQAEQLYGIKGDVADERRRAAAFCSGDVEPDLDDLYQVMQGFSDKEKRILKKLEFQIEKTISLPRRKMLDFFRYALSHGKEVYITSDTYFTYDRLDVLLRNAGVPVIEKGHLLISSDLKKTKQRGDIWQVLKERTGTKSILHIGDNMRTDIEVPLKYGIDTFYIMNSKDMLEHSSVSSIASRVISISDSVTAGLLLGKIFNDPFALCKTRGKIHFTQAQDFGYAVFGPPVNRFLSWLYGCCMEKQYDRLLFFARDGYFLTRDFEFFQELYGKKKHMRRVEWKYLPISRRMICVAAMESDDDLKKVALFPFIGRFCDYLRSRFNVKILSNDQHADQMISMPHDQYVLDWLLPYKEAIWKEHTKESRCYRDWLKRENVLGKDYKDAVVDYSFHGTNQYYWQKFMHRQYDGYYFLANFLPSNPYIKGNDMHACFNDSDDPDALSSLLMKKSSYWDSFLTAPYGMIRYIDDRGNIVCEPDKENQKHFDVKEEVNNGVCDFMKDYAHIIGHNNTSGVKGVEEGIFFILLDKSVVDDAIGKGFYFDNDFAGSEEVPLEN